MSVPQTSWYVNLGTKDCKFLKYPNCKIYQSSLKIRNVLSKLTFLLQCYVFLVFFFKEHVLLSVFLSSVQVSVCQDGRCWVRQEDIAGCPPVQQRRRVNWQPSVRVPVTVWREHPTGEAGLLKARGLPQKHSLRCETWVPHGSGECIV